MGKAPPETTNARRALGILQALIGIGAVAGGLGLILDPSGHSLGLPVELLANSPFDDFLVPGIVLLAVNGLATLAGAALTFRRHRRAPDVAVALGGFLMLWIVAQVVWLPSVSWLHPTYLALGVLEVALGAGLKAYETDHDPTPPNLKDITPIV